MHPLRNERIRGTVKVGEIPKRAQESRLKWYGHVLRREDEYVGRRVMAMEVPGKRRRGRPKRRWLDNIRNDLSERIVRAGNARPGSMEASHKNHRPHIKVGKDVEEEESGFKHGIDNKNCFSSLELALLHHDYCVLYIKWKQASVRG